MARFKICQQIILSNAPYMMKAAVIRSRESKNLPVDEDVVIELLRNWRIAARDREEGKARKR